MVKLLRGYNIDFRPGLLGQTAILGANLLTLVLPLVLVQLFDRVIPNNAHETLAVLASILACALVLEMVLRAAVSRLMAAEGEKYEVETQERLIDQLLNAGDGGRSHIDASTYFDAWETVERARAARVADTKHTKFDLPFSALFLAAFWYVTPALLYAMVGLLCVALVGSWLTRRRALTLGEKRRDQHRRGLSLSTEILTGIEHLKGLRAEPLMLRRLESLYANTANTTEAFVQVQSMGRVLTEVIAQATPLLIGLFGAVAVINETITAGALAAAILLSGRIMQPFLRQQQVSDQNRLLAPSLQTLRDILAPRENTQTYKCLREIETIEMENIRFLGRDGSPILNGIDLSVKAGEIIAITGGSGSGKSLFLRLLSGQLTPSGGVIRVNGVDVQDFDARDVAKQVSLMAQQARLPSGTALEVLSGYSGRQNLSHVLSVVEELGLSAFFAAHPQGMMVEVGGAVSRGLPSAVEARLPLVAKLASEPALLLFDEANGALDMESDQLLLKALKRRKGLISMIIVTQRPSYAALADRRYALEKGALREIDADGFMKRITKADAA